MAKTKLEIKVYDLYWLDKQKHIKAELERVIALNKLEDQLLPFDKTLEDYRSLAEYKLGITTEAPLEEREILEDLIAPKRLKKESKKSNKKPSNTFSIGIDDED